MHGRFFLGVEWLHQIDLDLERAGADGADVFVHVLAFAFVGAGHLQAKHVDPELLQATFVRPANGNLLDTQHFERAGHLLKLHDHLVHRERFAFGGHHFLDHAVLRREQHVFHLHGFDHGHAFTRLHLLAHRHGHVDQKARHG